LLTERKALSRIVGACRLFDAVSRENLAKKTRYRENQISSEARVEESDVFGSS
jgi:hypothetical protein